jgi:hypothetical protein
MQQQMVIKLKPGDGERSPERTALASAIDAHRKAKAELQDRNTDFEKAQESAWGLHSKLEKIQEDARAVKLAGYLPPGVAAVRERIQTCQPLPRMGN